MRFAYGYDYTVDELMIALDRLPAERLRVHLRAALEEIEWLEKELRDGLVRSLACEGSEAREHHPAGATGPRRRDR